MWNWIAKLSELQSTGVPFAVVTVTHCSGSTPREIGAKMLVTGTGEFHGTIGGGHLEELALQDARKCIDVGESRVIKYPLGAKTGQCCGGVMDLLIEVMNRGPSLYLFGAGHVGQALCRTLQGTPFQVQVIDERAEWVNSSEIPSGVKRHHCEWDEFVTDATWDPERTFVAIMTHRHDTDQDIIQKIVTQPARYIGLIGSEAKWTRFRTRLLDRGSREEDLAKVRSPIGLDIGGKSPQEVAISVASELLKVHYGK